MKNKKKGAAIVRFAHRLSIALCGIFTIAAIANLIAMTQGNRIGATGFGLTALAAYYSYRGLSEADERSMRTAWFTSVGFSVLAGLVAIFVLKLALDDQASMLRGSMFAAISACFIVIAVGVRQKRAIMAEFDSAMHVLDLARQIRFASGETLMDVVRGVRPPAPPAPTEPAATRPALYLSRTGLPVPLSNPARSYFGGLPKLPPTLAWPQLTRGDRTVAYMFVAQIDLKEVAACLKSELPERGTLYFFFDANTEYAHPESTRVLYYEQRADALSACPPPENLEPYGFGGESWPWLNAADQAASVAFKFPLSFIPFTSICDYEGVGSNEAKARINAELRTKVTRCDESIAPPNDVFVEASPAWPFNYASIMHASRALSNAVADPYGFKLKDKPAEVIERVASFRARANAWVERIADQNPLAPCDPAMRESFREHWHELSKELVSLRRESGLYSNDPRYLLRDALILSCCLASSDENEASQRVIPPEFRAALENDALWRFDSKNSLRADAYRHQMLGFGLSVQSAPADHANDELLLQINGDRILGWFPIDGCVLQFWIDRASLAALEFDAVQMTMDCD